jgi:hypothetical protein
MHDLISGDLSSHKELIIILAKWIEVLIVMLLLDDIKWDINESARFLVKDLSSVVAVRQQDSNQPIVSSDLLVMNSDNEILFLISDNWAEFHSVILLANTLEDFLLVSLETKLGE